MWRGYVVLLLALGCDPTSGLTDSAEAAAPNLKRYFDGAGTRVADGPWNRVVVDLDPDTLYHVGARRLDDREPTFHIFGADARDGCSVGPNAATWLMGKPQTAPYRVLPYLESSDEDGRGTLRFTTLDCEVRDVALEDAGRPDPYLYDSGYLVPTGQGYTLVDPWQGTTREIAKVFAERLVWAQSILLLADGKLKSFSTELEPGPELGDEIRKVVSIEPLDMWLGDNRHEYLVEDAHGLHRVTFDDQSLELENEDVLPDACHLLASTGLAGTTGGWAILELPCGSPPSLVRIDQRLEPHEQQDLPGQARSEHMRVLAVASLESEPELIAIVYLTDVADGRGTLWSLRAGASEPVKLAEHADLSRVTASTASTETEWDGYLQANYQVLGGELTYDFLRFRWNGETETLSERVVVNDTSGEVLINFDGVAADLPLASEDGVSILAEDVPTSGGRASSLVGEKHFARIDHFDGATGRLMLAENAEETAGRQELGRGVAPNSLRFSWFMPALLFLEDWDAERQVGSLVAHNYELDARTKIADGVSSFDLTSYPWDGVIYAVPYGSKKGLWFSKAK